MANDLRSSTFRPSTLGPSTRLTLILFGLLVAMCVVIGLVLVIGVAQMSEEHQPSHGFAHSEFKNTMQQGGSGVERHGDIRWLGLAFGLLEVAFFVGCLTLGLRQLKGRVGFFVFFGALYALAFALMVIFDHFYAQGKTRQIVLGFPLPTAFMVYGVGGAPLAFILLYILRFDRWILTPEDLARFELLVKEKRQQKGSDF